MDLYEARNKLNSGETIYNLPLKVTFYARVSTDKYEQANSLKNQVEYFENMITCNKLWQYVPGYIDEGISGTSVNKRDAFLKMIDNAKKQKFDFIITKEISRFSRNTLDSIKFTQELLSYGVGVLFQSDNINTLYPDAELRLTIMSSIAQEEVRKISERIKFGFKQSINNGRVLGNNAIWGYKKDNGRLIIDEEEAEIIRLIYSLYTGKRLGIRSISKELETMGYMNREGNKFSFSTIKNIIENPKYKGYYCGNKTRVVDYRLKTKVNINEDDWVIYKDEENVPAIIDEETWEQANRILNGRSEKTKNHESGYQSRYTYSGKIYCSEHGTAFHRAVYKYKSERKEVWQCKIYRESGKSGCNSPTLYTSDLDLIIKEAFEEFVIHRIDIIHRMINRYEIAVNSSQPQNELSKKQKEIDKIIQKKEKLLELSLDGKITNDEFAERNDALNENLNKLREEAERLESERDSASQNKQAIKRLAELIEKKTNLSNNNDIGEIVNTAIEKIIVHKSGDKKDKNKVKLEIFFGFGQSFEKEYDLKELRTRIHHFDSDVTYDKS